MHGNVGEALSDWISGYPAGYWIHRESRLETVVWLAEAIVSNRRLAARRTVAARIALNMVIRRGAIRLADFASFAKFETHAKGMPRNENGDRERH